MAKTLNRTITYRSANILPATPHDLETMLTMALLAHKIPADRTQVVAGGAQNTLNDTTTIGKTLCGLVLRYLPGDNQLVVEQEATAAVWKMLELPPPASPANSAAKRDFLPSVLFFGIQGNHIGVVQSPQYQAEHLADFFTWLLRKTPAANFGALHQIIFTPASAFQLRQKGIDKAKAIKINVPLAEEHSVPTPQKNGKIKTLVQKIVDPIKALKVTEALGALGIVAPEAVLNSEDAKDLEVRLEIRRPRNRDSLGNPAMNQLAILMASQTSEAYTIVMPDNTEISGNTLKINKDVEFTPASGSKHPAPFEVFKKIDEYLKGLLVSGKV